MRVLNLLIIYTLFTMSSNIIFGHTRQLFLCHGALAGISSYTSILLSMRLGFSPWITLPLGVLLSAGIGSLFSFLSSIRRLSLILLAILTLSFQLIFEEVVTGLRNITGGDEGLVIRRDVFGIFEQTAVGRELTYYYLLAVILFISIYIYHRITHSYVGVAFRSIVGDEVTASFIGVDVVKYKLLSALIGSLLLGLTGCLYAYYNLFITPSMFSLASVDVYVLVMLVFGGMGTLLGPLLGAGVFTFIFEILRPLGRVTTLIFGILLIVLFLYFREGLVNWLKRLLIPYLRQ